MREEITRRTGRGAAGGAAGDGALDAMMTAVPMRLGNDEQGDSGRADGRRVEGRRVEVGLPEHAALPQGEAWVVDPPEPRTGAGGSMHCVRLLAPGAGTLPLGALPPDPRVAAREWIRLAQGGWGARRRPRIHVTGYARAAAAGHRRDRGRPPGEWAERRPACGEPRGAALPGLVMAHLRERHRPQCFGRFRQVTSKVSEGRCNLERVRPMRAACRRTT